MVENPGLTNNERTFLRFKLLAHTIFIEGAKIKIQLKFTYLACLILYTRHYEVIAVAAFLQAMRLG